MIDETGADLLSLVAESAEEEREVRRALDPSPDWLIWTAIAIGLSVWAVLGLAAAVWRLYQ